MEKESEQFRQDAKWIVDSLFENKLFVDKLTRDDLMTIENYIEDAMQMRFDSHKRGLEFLKAVNQFKLNQNAKD